jgi:hypothetical protein
MATLFLRLRGVVDWIGTLLSGPFSGLIGGAISFLLLEMGYKKRRERHGIAEALAAELSLVAEELNGFVAKQDPNEIPEYFRTSHVVFDALANRLAELRFEDVLSTVKVYRVLDEMNRMPAAWREHALSASAMPWGHPDKESEQKAVKEGRADFYALLPRVREDCIGLATHLRTKYTIGWRWWIPLRLRPEKRIPKR